MAKKQQTIFLVGKQCLCPRCKEPLVDVGKYFCCNECESVYKIAKNLPNGIQVILKNCQKNYSQVDYSCVD